MAPCFPQGAHQTLCLVLLLFLMYLSMDFSQSLATSIWVFPSFLTLALYTGAIPFVTFFLEVSCPFSLFFLVFKVFEGLLRDGATQVSSDDLPLPYTEIPSPFIRDRSHSSALTLPPVRTLLSIWDYYSLSSPWAPL